MKSLSILMAAAWLALGTVATVAADKGGNTANGTWTLNSAKSKFTGPAFKSQTRTYAEAADGTTTMSFTGKPSAPPFCPASTCWIPPSITVACEANASLERR